MQHLRLIGVKNWKLVAQASWAWVTALLFGASALAAGSDGSLQVEWLGISGLLITDGRTQILVDPTFTKPSFEHWLGLSRFDSDPDRVRRALRRLKVSEAQAIFVSHEHFDHSVDVAQVALQTGATVYGGASLERVVKPTLARSQKSLGTFSQIQDGGTVKVGEFKVTAMRRFHPPILQKLGWKFLPGDVPLNFDFGFYDYREGEVWSFAIEHPAGNLLVDQGSHAFEGNFRWSGKMDAFFVGVANKVSLQHLVRENILKIGAKKVIPLHFDFFFLQSDALEGWVLPGMDLVELGAAVREQSGGKSEWIVPEMGRRFGIR